MEMWSFGPGWFELPRLPKLDWRSNEVAHVNIRLIPVPDFGRAQASCYPSCTNSRPRVFECVRRQFLPSDRNACHNLSAPHRTAFGILPSGTLPRCARKKWHITWYSSPHSSYEIPRFLVTGAGMLRQARQRDPILESSMVVLDRGKGSTLVCLPWCVHLGA